MTYAAGHLIKNYLPLTQTFIYQILQHAHSFKPFVLTDVAQNLNLFPTDCTYLIKQKEFHRLKQQLGPKRQKRITQKLLTELNYPNCFAAFIQEHSINILHAHIGFYQPDLMSLIDTDPNIGFKILMPLTQMMAQQHRRDMQNLRRLRRQIIEYNETTNTILAS